MLHVIFKYETITANKHLDWFLKLAKSLDNTTYIIVKLHRKPEVVDFLVLHFIIKVMGWLKG
jgi:hypothetical protein